MRFRVEKQDRLGSTAAHTHTLHLGLRGVAVWVHLGLAIEGVQSLGGVGLHKRRTMTDDHGFKGQGCRAEIKRTTVQP